ncbi:hypothetical protein [Paenibacillus apiarius]|uniref:hypothetical protein n=1 Tax=Paenibacillus apiarius TaxID=46240 RepID=UPI003B3A3F0D
MNKKFVVLIASLSLTLSVFAPTTSFAALQDNKGAKAETYIEAWKTDAEAKKMAQKHARHLVDSFINKINKYLLAN